MTTTTYEHYSAGMGVEEKEVGDLKAHLRLRESVLRRIMGEPDRCAFRRPKSACVGVEIGVGVENSRVEMSQSRND